MPHGSDNHFLLAYGIAVHFESVFSWVTYAFIEGLMGTIRQEYLDHLLFWNETDLMRKLDVFKEHYNNYRIHQSLNQHTPEEVAEKPPSLPVDSKHFVWQSHCQRLFQTPIAA